MRALLSNDVFPSSLSLLNMNWDFAQQELWQEEKVENKLKPQTSECRENFPLFDYSSMPSA